MAKTYLNDALKAKAAEQARPADDGEIKLDDVSRVKVLSPGRQVFKRFIRNRLAVFGSILLITMFVFSFIGPLFYAYGQKRIFYKYDAQVVNYAMAKENTAYNGIVIDENQTVERSVNNAINSRIKSMIENGEESRLLLSDSGAYLLEKLDEDIYQLSVVEAEKVCTVGLSKVKVGVFNSINRSIEYSPAFEEVEGLGAAAAAAVKNKDGSFTHEGVTYTYEPGKTKTYTLYTEVEGINYAGEAKDEAFEAAMGKALETGKPFRFDGTDYVFVAGKDASEVYAVSGTAPAKVYSRLTVDAYETGAPVSTELRLQALLHAKKGGSFTADGAKWSVARENGVLVVRDADGKEYLELTPFSVRRYNGEDTMAFDLKKALEEKVVEMRDSGVKEASLHYLLPQQGDNGEYVYDENGQLQYRETELNIVRRDMSGSETGEYVITAEQVIYVIDMFAKPSAKHILGTDGDGFDVLARIMYGGRVSLMVGFVVVFLECFLGIIMGGLAGYYGGWVDMLIMRLVDIFYCLPSLPIMIILGAMMDALRMNTYLRLLIMMAALGIMGWAGVARLVRGQILSLREQEFMVATEATGIKVKDRIFHHLVPNVMPQLIVTATMGMGGVIITESTLSYLGLGVKHPLATWGTIINSVSSASAMAHYAHIWIPVGLLICLTVIAFNFVGDGLRDAYDPKAKR